MKEMVGGCCVCSDERGWAENPLVYCDGHGCNVAVHQACYGIVQVPTGPWFCRKCESQERAARVRCELCPHKDGALKRTDNGGWAHVVCALYVPEVQFANVISMEPIVLQYVPHERFNKTCYLCEEQGRESKAATGACMTCNRHGCRQAFHVTCAQMAGLLCEEQGSEIDNVKYCGYCKYHFNKVKKCRHSASTAYDQGLSDSSSHSQDKLSSLYDKQRKSRKDRERPKQKLKKSTESLNTVVSTVTVTAEKTCTTAGSSSSIYMSGTLRDLDQPTTPFTNKHFQGASAPHVSGKETTEVARSEAKGKKAPSHGSSQRGRKAGVGKSLASVSTVSTASPFQQGSLLSTSSSSLQPSQEVGIFSKPELRGDTYSVGHNSSQNPASYDVAEGTLSSYNSLIRFSSAPPAPKKPPESSPTDFRTSAGLGGPSSGGTGYKRPQPVAGMEEEETVKEKRHKASKKSKHGRGRPKGSKNESSPSLAIPMSLITSSTTDLSGCITSPALPKLTPSTSYTGAIPSLSLEPSLLGSGVYANKEIPLTLSGGMLGTGCSTAHSSNILPHHRTGHLMHLSRPSLPGSMTATASISSSQVLSLPGSSYNLTPSNVFGGPITPGTSITSLLNPVETSQTEPDLDDNDCSFVCRGSSSRGSLSPTSPIGGLSTLYDQTIPSQLENVPQTTSNIEELLDKHWSGEGGIDIVDMLKSLHLLQLDNQRLQEQIMNLSAKKERLQLLNVQLSIPFASVTPSNGPSSQAHLMTSQNACSPELLNSSKSPPSKSSFITENSLSASSEDLRFGCHSRSSSSSSLQSTPPIPLPPLQQSAVSLQIPGMTGIQQQINGLTRTCVGSLGAGVSMATAAFSSTLTMGGMMGCPPGNQLASNGIVGPLNGVNQSSASVASIHNSLPHTSASLNVPPLTSLSNSVSRLGQIPDQQRQFLYQQQQQQQLQQLLTSQQLTPDQQALIYQMMQQQQQQQHRQRELQRLQMSGTSQLPVNNLVQGTPSLPVHSGPNNSFLSVHADSSVQKAQRLNDKVNQEKS
ncbi:protein AF-10-like isoform X2 [Stegostoma tigrinum]|uniref:protein AF-10-like isoform X2 n=1 Tax=Stegostoma tigrinum TaxID=3053191 RepID=UPI0028701538|nr:protein AF-10-like isoform X2 [Stegostoma tigrinum]